MSSILAVQNVVAPQADAQFDLSGSFRESPGKAGSDRMILRPISAWVAAGLLVLAITPNAGRSQQTGGGQPGTKWNDEQLRRAVAGSRVGRRLTPKSWPDHARVAVMLSFDTDTEAPLLRDGTISATTLSASDFGAESGMPRILRMLDHYTAAHK